MRMPILVSDCGDFRRFGFSPMIAPEIVVIERLKIFVHRDDGRAGGVESDGFDGASRDARFLNGSTRSSRESDHMAGVRLGGKFGIVATAIERIFAQRGSQEATFAVHDGDANAQSAEINASEICHFRDRFQNDGVLRSFGRGRAPRERSMIGDENGGDFARIDILKEAGDGVPGVFFIGGGDFLVGHGIGDWHRTAEIVAMRGAEAGNCLARLGPSGGVLGMRVADTADFREGFV